MFEAQFNGTNGAGLNGYVSESGHTITADAGWKFQDNMVYNDVAAEQLATVGTYASVNGQTTVMRVAYNHIDNTGNTGVFFAATDSNNGYLLQFLSGNVRILPRVAGTFQSSLGLVALPYAQGFLDVIFGSGSITLKDSDGNTLFTSTNLHVSLNEYGSIILRSSAAMSSTTGYHIDSIISDQEQAAAVLSNPEITASADTTATAEVTIDIATGTLYSYFSTNAIENATTIQGSGTSQAVTASGVQTVNATGLPDGTDLYCHFYHTGFPNASNVVTTARFRTVTSQIFFPNGTYPVSILATAPDLSTDTDTGTLTVNGAIPFTGVHQAQPSTHSGVLSHDPLTAVISGGTHQAQSSTGSGVLSHERTYDLVSAHQAQPVTHSGILGHVGLGAVLTGNHQAQSSTGSGVLSVTGSVTPVVVSFSPTQLISDAVFTVTTTNAVDLTAMTSVSATLGGLELGAGTVTSPTTVTFTVPRSGLLLNATYSFVLEVSP